MESVKTSATGSLMFTIHNITTYFIKKLHLLYKSQTKTSVHLKHVHFLSLLVRVKLPSGMQRQWHGGFGECIQSPPGEMRSTRPCIIFNASLMLNTIILSLWCQLI